MHLENEDYQLHICKYIICICIILVNTKYTLRVFIDKLQIKTITCIFVSSVLVYLCVCICTCRVFIDLLRMKTISYIFVFVYLCICISTCRVFIDKLRMKTISLAAETANAEHERWLDKNHGKSDKIGLKMKYVKNVKMKKMNWQKSWPMIESWTCKINI